MKASYSDPWRLFTALAKAAAVLDDRERDVYRLRLEALLDDPTKPTLAKAAGLVLIELERMRLDPEPYEQ